MHQFILFQFLLSFFFYIVIGIKAIIKNSLHSYTTFKTVIKVIARVLFVCVVVCFVLFVCLSGWLVCIICGLGHVCCCCRCSCFAVVLESNFLFICFVVFLVVLEGWLLLLFFCKGGGAVVLEGDFSLSSFFNEGRGDSAKHI